MSEFDQKQKEFWSDHTNLRPIDHPIVQYFSRQRIDYIKKLLPESDIDSILEVGCGDGFGMTFLQDICPNIYGSDISLAMLHNNPVESSRLSLADAYKLPYRDNRFDLVYCWELLHHIDNPHEVLLEMKRVSRRFVLIFEPNALNIAQTLFGLLTPAERGTLRFTPGFVKKIARQAGLADIRSFTGGWFTPNRTPAWLFNILKTFPYRVPLVGISNVLFARLDR